MYAYKHDSQVNSVYWCNIQYIAKVCIYCIYMYFLQEKLVYTQNVLEMLLAEDC